MEERNNSGYTPLFRSGFGGIMTPESKYIPFTPVEAFKLTREEIVEIIEKAYAATFRKKEKEEEPYFLYLLMSYRFLAAQKREVVSKLYERITLPAIKKACRALFELYSIDESKEVGAVIRAYNSQDFSFCEPGKDKLVDSDAIALVRFFRPVTEIMHYSLNGVERVFIELGRAHCFSFENLPPAVNKVKTEVESEIKEIEESNAALRDKLTGDIDGGYRWRLKTRINGGEENIERKKITLSFLDTIIPAFEDYLSDNYPQVPFMKRILIDALSQSDWKADYPCFVTKEDRERICSDNRLLQNGKYYIYIAEARPMSTLKEVLDAM